MAGETAFSCTTSHSKSRQPGAVTSARRTAVPTDSGVNPAVRTLGQGPADGGRDARGIRLHGKPGDGRVDVGEGVVGLEEEVAREVEVGDAPVLDLEVDHHELAARNLVFPVHDSSVRGRDSPPAHAGIPPSTHIRAARSTR